MGSRGRLEEEDYLPIVVRGAAAQPWRTLVAPSPLPSQATTVSAVMAHLLRSKSCIGSDQVSAAQRMQHERSTEMVPTRCARSEDVKTWHAKRFADKMQHRAEDKGHRRASDEIS